MKSGWHLSCRKCENIDEFIIGEKLARFNDGDERQPYIAISRHMLRVCIYCMVIHMVSFVHCAAFHKLS